MRRVIQGVVVCAALVGADAVAQQAVQWKVSEGGNGHWYQCLNAGTELRWSDADSSARAQGGHLASLTSISENEFVFQRVASDPLDWSGGANEQGPWLGGQLNAGIWTWSTGEPMEYTAWCGGLTSPPERFVQFNHCGGSGTPPAATWNDHWGAAGGVSGDRLPVAFIIEWSADCNDDGIVDYGQCRDGTLADINSNNVPDCCEAGIECPSPESEITSCAVFSRPTDTVRIIGANTELGGDYTIEWSGFVLNAPVVANPPATWNARIWSEQDSVIEDKGVGLNSDGTAGAWVNSYCFSPASSPLPLQAGVRCHVALVRAGDVLTLYVNGMAVSAAPQACEPLNGGGSNMALGAFVYVGQPASSYWRAAPVALDWFRVTAFARYGSGFQPPREPLIADAGTQMLINFNGDSPWRDVANPLASLVPSAGVAGGTAPTLSTDCDSNGLPDEVEITLPGADTDSNGVLDACEAPTCSDADLFPSGTVNGADLGILLSQWGSAPAGTVSDLNRDGTVDGADLGLLLSFWGACNN